MSLPEFVSGLFSDGALTVSGDLLDFTETALQETETELERQYYRDILEMPGQAPAFHPEAALWGFGYCWSSFL